MLIYRREGLLASQYSENVLHRKPLKPNRSLQSTSSSVASQGGVPVLDQARVRPGLILKDIQPHGEDVALLECVSHGLLIDEAATRNVDQTRALLHLGNGFAVNDLLAAGRG
jgi:hypothetical protein